MKVLYFHQHFSTPQGATGTRSYENAIELINRGHSVTMVCGSFKSGATGLSGDFEHGKRTGVVDGISVIEIDLPYANQQGLIRRSIVFLKFAMRSIRIAMTEECDIVFATSTPLTASIPGIFARVLRKKRFVFEVRDLWPELPKAMGVLKNPIAILLLDVLERASYKAADSCIGLSPGIVDGIKKKAGSQKSVKLIPNGCDKEFFDTVGSRKRSPLRSSPTDVVAVFTGAHGRANGLDAVLEAALILVRRGRRDIRIVLIGDGQEKAALVERCANEHIENIKFISPVPKTELRDLLAGADIGLMILANVPAFYYGTSPNKFFDYIALGLPVLNNYPGWLAGMIEDERLGLVVPPEQAEELANALEYLADHPEERRAMGARSRSFAKQHFDRAVLSRDFSRELERVAGL